MDITDLSVLTYFSEFPDMKRYFRKLSMIQKAMSEDQLKRENGSVVENKLIKFEIIGKITASPRRL